MTPQILRRLMIFLLLGLGLYWIQIPKPEAPEKPPDDGQVTLAETEAVPEHRESAATPDDKKVSRGAVAPGEKVAGPPTGTTPVLTPTGTIPSKAAVVDPVLRQKKVAVLNMVEEYLGEEKFRDIIRQYLEHDKSGPADTNAFLDALSSAGAEEAVIESMRDYLWQPGFPVIDVSFTCPSGGGVNISLTQSPYSPVGVHKTPQDTRQWDTPVCMTLVQKDARRERQCFWLRRASQTLYARKSMCPEAVMPDSEGKGYYRWSLEEGGWSRLAAVLDRLDDREALSYAVNLSSALWSGRLDFGRYRELLAPVARRKDEVAAAPLDDLDFILRQFVGEPAFSGPLADWARDLYGPPPAVPTLPDRQEAGPDHDRPYEHRVLAFYSRTLEDEAVRAELAEQGRALLSRLEQGGKTITPVPATGDLALLALLKLDRDRDGEAGRRLLGVLDRLPDVPRAMSLWTLARSGDKALTGDLLEMIGTGGRLSGNDALQAISGMMETPSTRTRAWSWLEANFDQLVQTVPGDRAKEIVELGRFFCTADGRQKVTVLMGPRAASLEGGQRAFDATVEAVDICIARRELIRGQVGAQSKSASHPPSSEPVKQAEGQDLR